MVHLHIGENRHNESTPEGSSKLMSQGFARGTQHNFDRCASNTCSTGGTQAGQITQAPQSQSSDASTSMPVLQPRPHCAALLPALPVSLDASSARAPA